MNLHRLFIICLAALMLSTSISAHAGMRPQGMRPQGMRPQGMRPQGMRPQGMRPQGMRPQGMRPQGMRPQGMRPQGMRPQGMRPQGNAAQTPSPPPTHRAPWLQGSRLIVVRNDDTRLEITEFAGNRLDAFEHHPAAGTTESVTIHPLSLVGTRFSESRCVGEQCQPRTYRITHVTRDSANNTMPKYGDNHDVWLYRIEFTQAQNLATATWTPVCGGKGKASGDLGLFVAGQWADDGAWYRNGYTFSCTGGVIAKCVRDWGYKPWKSLYSATYGMVSLQPLHLACTRAARAEYCGDGISHTREGTLIDIFDVYGFNSRTPGSGFGEESIFSTAGAEFIRRPRFPHRAPHCAPTLVSAPTRAPLISVWSRSHEAALTPNER